MISSRPITTLYRIITLFVVITCLALPSYASAHAVLIDTVPADETVVKQDLNEITLRFNEHVNVAFGGTKVWGPNGKRVDTGEAESSRKVVDIPIKARADGTYAASYRIISADGHPIRGAITFHLRKRSDDSRSEAAAKKASAENKTVEISYGAARGIALISLMLLAGGIAFVSFIAPGAHPRLLKTALVAAILSIGASFILDAMNATGLAITEALKIDVLKAELSTTWGRSAAFQIALLILLSIWLRIIDLRDVRSLTRGVVVAIPAFLPLVAWSTGGHAIADSPVWIRLPLDILHLSAAALWIGGLIQLIGYLRYDAIAVEHIERYSKLMVPTIGVLVLTGLYASWSEIGLSRAAVADTTYGRLVVAKVLLLVGIAPLAMLNKRHNVPGLRGREPYEAKKKLRTYVLGEMALAVLVVAATAALIQTPPARIAVNPGLVDVEAALPSGAKAQLIIDPARVGSNEIHVYAMTKTDRLDAKVSGIELRADGPRGIENFKIPMLRSGPGHYTTPARTIPFAGVWKFNVVIQRGKFDAERGVVRAQIGKKTQ